MVVAVGKVGVVAVQCIVCVYKCELVKMEKTVQNTVMIVTKRLLA